MNKIFKDNKIFLIIFIKKGIIFLEPSELLRIRIVGPTL